MARLIVVIAALGLFAIAEAQATYKIEALPNSFGILNESPHWDIAKQSLYFVDILSAAINRYDYKTNTTYKAIVQGEKVATFIIPIKGQEGKFAVGCDRRIAIVAWDGVSPTAIVERNAFEVENDAKYVNNRFNDAKADKTGRLLAGTMNDDQADRLGSLYSFGDNKQVKRLLTGTGISNGMAWNDETKKFYFIDSTSKNVTEYDYCYSTGNIRNPRIVWQHPTYTPDGMTIDAAGNIYIATFDGSRVIKVNPITKKVLLEIILPAKQISSAAFGGPNLDILYVTTSSANNEPAPAGNTFQVTGLGVNGLPMSYVVI